MIHLQNILEAKLHKLSLNPLTQTKNSILTQKFYRFRPGETL